MGNFVQGLHTSLPETSQRCSAVWNSVCPILPPSCSPFAGVGSALQPRGPPHPCFSFMSFIDVPQKFTVHSNSLDTLFSCKQEVLKQLQILIPLSEILWAKCVSKFKMCLFHISYTTFGISHNACAVKPKHEHTKVVHNLT